MKRTLAGLLATMICLSIAHGAEITILAATATGTDAPATTTFAPDTPAVFALLQMGGVQKGDKLRAVWIADDVGKVAPANTKIAEKTMTMEGIPNEGSFSCTKPAKHWPAGKYHVDIYANDKLAATAKFTVEDNK